MDAIALDLLENARKTKMAVTRDVLRSFGRSARATLLADPAASKEVKARVEDFKARGAAVGIKEKTFWGGQVAPPFFVFWIVCFCTNHFVKANGEKALMF